MTQAARSPAKPDWRASRRPVWIVLALLAASLVIFANVHLVYVAVKSQPDCAAVEDGAAETFRAAKPSC